MSSVIDGLRPDDVLGHDMTALDPEMVEVTLLLPRRQAVALQHAAKQRGISAAQLLRRMIGAAVGGQPPVPAAF